MRATVTITSRNHAEWLESRAKGIGSSEVATVLGANPYDTPYRLWLRKTGRVAQEERENFLMKAGHYLEDAISRFCADEANLDIVKASAAEFVVADRAKPFMRVSPDRYAYPSGSARSFENRFIVECKSTQKPVDPDNLSQYWLLQVFYQMHVTRIKHAYLAWLVQGREFGCRRIDYDPEVGAYIEDAVERFWVDCVLGGREPDPSDVEDLKLKYPMHEPGKCAYADDGAAVSVARLCDIGDEIRKLQAEKETLEDSIKAEMREAEMLVVRGTGMEADRVLCTWKSGKPVERFDTDAFRRDNPELYARYVKESAGARRFVLKK